MPNYLKYSIRKIDGKPLLYNDKGEVVDVDKKIPQKGKVYFTTWCVLVFTKDRHKKAVYPQSIDFLTGKIAILWEYSKTAIPFKKNSLVGWKSPDNKLIMPPIFEQIEICKDYIWVKYANRQIFFYKKGGYSDKPKFDNSFYQNSKQGWKNDDGTILFPAIYDEIYKWQKDSDVFYTLIGKDFHYYNSNHEEILTTYKQFDGINDELCPYYIYERQNHGVLVSMQLTDNLLDSQSCICFGQKVRLDRILKSDIDNIIKNNCEVWNKGQECLIDFDSYFTYIYSAYWAESDSKTPIQDCMNQFIKMNCYNTSWAFLVKIWINSQTKISTSELNKLVEHFQDLEKCVFGICNPMSFVTIGYDDSLPEGKVKMFQVRYAYDRPPYDYDDIYDDALSGDIDNYLIKKQLLIDTIKKDEAENISDKHFYQSIYNAFFFDNGIGSDYRSFDKKDTKLFDYLIEKEGFSVRNTAFRICQHLSVSTTCGITLRADEVQKAYQMIKWALGHNSSLLLVVKSHSSLDFIQESIKCVKKSREHGLKTMLKELEKIERLLIKHGALSAAKIRELNINPLQN